jgi:hypothetical protein
MGIEGTVPSNNGFGVVTGTGNAVAFPDIEVSKFRIKAGLVQTNGWIGSFGYATFPVEAGWDSGWNEVDNMSDIYYRGTGTYFHYWFQD